MTKINNNFTLVGRVTRIQGFVNKDGSLTRMINIATSTGKDRTDFVECERYIPFDQNAGRIRGDVTDHLTVGSRLVASGYLKNVSFCDKASGEIRYKTSIRVTHVSLLDSKAETQALRQKNAQKAMGQARNQPAWNGYDTIAAPAGQPVPSRMQQSAQTMANPVIQTDPVQSVQPLEESDYDWLEDPYM